jgi:hypothetical protein
MKKGTFYIISRKGYGREAKIFVTAVDGYVEGDIGLDKRIDTEWAATHTPTGTRLAVAPTRREALELAQELTRAPTFEAMANATMGTKYHEQFIAGIQKLQGGQK